MSFTFRMVALTGLIALLGNVRIAQSLDIAYCANINTASTSANSSTWQSNGLCHDFCLDNYAFAIVQDKQCWCSNYTPDESDQVDTTKCDSDCPGYPDDKCGGDGVYGYISLDASPSGTKGADSSSSSTSSSSPNPVTETVHDTVTATPSTSTVHTPTVQSTTSVPDSTDDSSSTATSATSATISVHTVTAGGTVSLQTVTVAPTSTASAGASEESNSTGAATSQHGISTGQAVGIAIGVLAVVVIAIAAGVFLWLRRKRQGQGDMLADGPGSHRGSSAGMTGTPTTAMASVWDGDDTSTGRRNSRFMPHDPRMDPYAANIYSRDNKSHESINTLQDNHDYSRKVLRTTNPDPDDE
ncbi:hypothetical protein M426DRAFT_12724 [Hypoxylon sp. CI-4A]|nr:hypothetical protein M426DRAFT_12724 [Hypoxylon sp. CI-4A]